MEVDSGASVASLEADCAELRGMLEKAGRPTVQRELQRVLDTLHAELSKVKWAFLAAGDAAVVAAAAPAVAAAPAAAPKPAVVKSAGPWTEITTFGLEMGGYNSPIVVLDIRLKGVEALPAANVTCDFTQESLDLKVVGLDGKNHRFFKTNLDKDIVPASSGVKVKKNHVIVTLQKVKGEYGYDHWSDLCAKGRRKPSGAKKSDNPSGGIMDMMQDLYEDGDESMKKIIGEAMYKAKKGEKYEPKDDGEFQMPKPLEED
eukprot:CAMPEP_0177365066 /NCGR_PEP_ID=MMETSP0368-20130122/39119_1 /TAXON_ID=447022 ORGANISM="Scrippsiella hangoei-like, Strain SHHI-4" /NCGR_SAMPLE_ID=MMETSP0368 /ASSEMBLY_ACC=CAM_ASM_000363 /LENGTH=258 /DNA_ID=CAMNT_0018827957 /DNA_START=32 /DNA_END=808 /DNA_ORIENTATION=+